MIVTLNKPNKTISIHKDTCEFVAKKLKDVNLADYPNGYQTGNGDNQLWFDEVNFTVRKAQFFFKGNDFGKIFCSKCF